jgi:hypothetical protein
MINARNMIDTAQMYPLKLLNYPGNAVRINGRSYTRREIDQGILLPFGAHEQRKLIVELHEQVLVSIHSNLPDDHRLLASRSCWNRSHTVRTRFSNTVGNSDLRSQ